MTPANGALTTGPTALDVEVVVRAVLAELNRAKTPVAKAAPEVFPGRLLSLAQAEALPPGVRSIAVAPGTVVTPLARDYLKRHGVELRIVARSAVAQNTGEWGFVIASTSGMAEALRRGLLDDWSELGRSVDEAIAWVAADEHRGAFVVTDDGAVAVYRACQSPGVRAASACDVESASRAIKGLGVNLLVVEPAGKPIPLLKHIAAAFRRAGAPITPDSFKTNGGRP